MRRVLFRVREHTVWSYPVMLYLGLVCGFYVIYAVAPSVGMSPGPAAAATLILFVPAIVGARLWFVIDHWTVYRHERARIWRRSDGGMALYGGLVLALLLSPAVLAALGLRFVDFWDGATFTLLVGMIFTRLGCLLNGCCSGRPSQSRFGLWLRDHAGHTERRYPVQLVEMAAAMLLLGGSALLLAIHAPRGTIFAFGLLGYAGVRVGFDRLRESPSLNHVSHRLAVTAFVLSSAAIFAAGWLVSGL